MQFLLLPRICPDTGETDHCAIRASEITLMMPTPRGTTVIYGFRQNPLLETTYTPARISMMTLYPAENIQNIREQQEYEMIGDPDANPFEGMGPKKVVIALKKAAGRLENEADFPSDH